MQIQKGEAWEIVLMHDVGRDWSIHKVATEPLQDMREGKLFGGAPPPVRIPSVIVHVIKSLRPSPYLHTASDQRLEVVEMKLLRKPIMPRYKRITLPLIHL